MAKNENLELDDVLKEFNTFTESPEVVVFKNPVLNALFMGNDVTGGIPRGAVAQIAAQSGTGKSTIALEITREFCEQGLNVLYIDAEKGVNFNMLKSMNLLPYVDNHLHIVRSCDCNEINTLIIQIALTHSVDFIILDSLGSLDSGIYGLGGTNVNNPKVGADSRSLKIVMKTINRVAMTDNIGFIIINHVAAEIGSYIPKENPVGGQASIYLSDIIIKLTKKSSDYEKANIGQKVEFEATKSRYGRGKSKIPFYIWFGHGIAKLPTMREVLDKIEVDYEGTKRPILDIRGGGNGSLYIKDKELKFRGETQLFALIKDNYDYISSLVSWKMFLPPEPDSSSYLLDVEDNNEVDVESDLPEELKDLKVENNDNKKATFKSGVDATGQEYALYFTYKTNRLTLEYDSQIESSTDITKDGYKVLDDKLKKYLSDCKKEMK